MKTMTLNKNLVFFSFVLLILASCSPAENREFERGLEVVFIGILQVINLVIFGVLALVFCIISANNPSKTYKVLGWLFLAFFFLGFTSGVIMLSNANPREFTIYYIFIMEMIMIVISLIFVIRKPKSSIAAESNEAYLDKIIDDVDEVL